jgi:SAM-dependent methyltransferase
MRTHNLWNRCYRDDRLGPLPSLRRRVSLSSRTLQFVESPAPPPLFARAPQRAGCWGCDIRLAALHTANMGSSYYERIGVRYSATRRPDSRIADVIFSALGDAESVVNVGAGTGSYEPTDRRVVAVEPSGVMLGQRASGTASAVQAVAEALPFSNDAFEAAMAVLTLHHWSHPVRGLAELRRVASNRAIVLTITPDLQSFWLTTRYFPAIGAWDAAHFPPIEVICSELGGTAIVTRVLIPSDCQDGFLGAFWRRPHSYLDPDVQAGISTFLLIREDERRRGERLLSQELENGEWHRRFGHLLELEELDLGYRLVTAQL